MSSKQTLFEFFNSKEVQALVAVAGLLMVIFNLIIASRISPLANSISLVNQAVARLEKADEQFVPRAEIDASVINRLDRIESKLDRALEK